MSKQYDEYLKEHRVNVNRAADWMLTHLPACSELTDDQKNDFVDNVLWHDHTKFAPEEYIPYDAYFYGEKDEKAFNAAWLHHIHYNSHHWQHWLLMNDDGKVGDLGKFVAIEMPKICALEMIADWWSFSWQSNRLGEMFAWYAAHKDCIVLNEATRAYVERVLDEIRERLGEG